MNRDLFIEEMKKAEKMNINEILSVIGDSIKSNIGDGNPVGHKNLIIVMEELSELAKEISKELRGSGDKTNIIEELADNQIGTYYVKQICNISDDTLDKAVAVKINRLKNVIEDNRKYATICIKDKKTNNLIENLFKTNKYEEAIEIVNKYNKYYEEGIFLRQKYPKKDYYIDIENKEVLL